VDFEANDGFVLGDDFGRSEFDLGCMHGVLIFRISGGVFSRRQASDWRVVVSFIRWEQSGERTCRGAEVSRTALLKNIRRNGETSPMQSGSSSTLVGRRPMGTPSQSRLGKGCGGRKGTQKCAKVRAPRHEPQIWCDATPRVRTS